MVIRNDQQGLKPGLQNFLLPVADGPESFRLLTVHPVFFGGLTLKRLWDSAPTDPKAGDLCDGIVQWHLYASTTKGYVPKSGEKKEVPEWQERPERFASDSFFLSLIFGFWVSVIESLLMVWPHLVNGRGTLAFSRDLNFDKFRSQSQQ